MTFSSTINQRTVFGNKKITWGTYANGPGDTGGDIDTGLMSCEMITLHPKGANPIVTASVVDETVSVATGPRINETLPAPGSAVTVVTADNEEGYWIAFGY